ncbi:MAG: pyridoxamine 5'-phosphate oxidase family protein [Chitinophagaceae bacterium]
MNSDATNDLTKFKELVNDIRVATLVTYSQNDGMRGRPMSTAQVGDMGDLWFFTNEYSGKVNEIAADNDVLISYASRSDNSYVIVKGTSELIDDKSKIESLWNPALKVWFPQGLSDPSIMLLKVEPVEVEFWDGNSSKIVVAFKMLKAYLTGKEYKDGEHKKIDVHED